MQVDPTKPPPPAVDPTELIGKLFQAIQARDYWVEEMRILRTALADMYCANANGGYSSKTIDVGGGYKLEFSVTKTLKIDTRNPLYLEWHKTAPPAVVNTLFKTTPSKLTPSLTGYNSLDDATKAAIASALSFDESVSATFKQVKDER